MSILQAIILGIVQGFTEFLPISSSGHLIIFEHILAANSSNGAEVLSNDLTFDIVVHLGTLVAVFIAFWKDILFLIKKPFQKMTYLLIVSTIPTVFVGVFLKDYVATMFDNGKFLIFAFCYTGVILLYASKASLKNSRCKKESEITYLDALAIGIMQAIAVIPGISRSGSTISGGLFRKLNRESAAKFSFLMAIPAILGALIMQLKDIASGAVVVLENPIVLVCGFVASLLAGYLSISFMLDIIKKCKLQYFAYYVFALAFLVLIDQNFTHLFFS